MVVKTRIIEQIYQDATWQDSAGKVHRVEDMEFNHRANVVKTLIHQSPRLYDMVKQALSSTTQSHAKHALTRHVAMEPHAWIETTPLMLKLRSLDKPAPDTFVRAKRKANKRPRP